MRHILIPSDFSLNAYNAAYYAIMLFTDEPCMFYLLNSYQVTVHHPGYFTQNDVGDSVIEIANQKSKKGLNQLEEKLKINFRNQQHKFKKISTKGLFINAIENIVNEKEIDLIVMGTQGVTADANRFIGSNTLETIKQINCPVIAVPENYVIHAPKQLLLSTDLGKYTKNTYLNILKDIANLHKSTINILKVKQEVELSSEHIKNMAYLEHFFKNQSYIFHLIESKSVLSEIDLLALETNLNLFDKIFLKSLIA